MKCQSASSGDRPVEGFTRIELVAGLAALLLLVPLLSANHHDSRAAVCLNNVRQLAAAMALYSANTCDYLPPNPNDGNTVPGHNWCSGRMDYPPQATNLMYLTNASYNSLAAFLDGNVRVFKCPEDQKLANNAPSVRSYSLNHAVGTICPGYEANLSVNGPWLDGTTSHHRNSPYATYGKVTEFRKPSQVFTFIDEDPYSINDGSFIMSVAVAKWVDFPSTGHDCGGTLVFADGHAEIHHWLLDSTRITNQVPVRMITGDPRDWQWLAERTTQKYLAK